MARILRGEVRWADLNPTKGHEQSGLRPVLILSQNIFNNRSGTVIAVALTSRPQRAKFPLTLELNSNKLPKQSWGEDKSNPHFVGRTYREKNWSGNS